MSAQLGVRRHRRTSRWRLACRIAGAAFLAVVVAYTPAAYANHGLVSLAGSDFEIDTDANLKVDHPAPSLDWANVTEIRKADSPSGSGDESFGQGTKEDTAVPTVVDGSIPPNKSDLKFFGVYQEGTTSTGFLHLFWSRVQDPVGTTNMDFEFNQSTTASANGITPVRTAGDLLITYDLSKGGTVPTLSLRKWTGSVWGAPVDLSDTGDATGSINTSAIPEADSDGLGAHSARTFGEASIDLSAIFDPNQCQTFGSAYLKSRASDSFTAALKDFVPPEEISISNCGAVKIIKTDDMGAPLAGAEFTLFKDNDPVGGSRGAEDTSTGQSCTTNGSGTCTIPNVLQGEYWVVETVVPPGHDGAADQHVTVVADETVVVGPLENPRHRGAIKITKTAKHADTSGNTSPNLVASFTITGAGGPYVVATDANGVACVDDLLFGSYTVTETGPPAGYQAPGPKNVTVDNKATCGGDPYVGESVSFENTPLTDITVSVDSQVPGGTNSVITCDGEEFTTDSNGDGSLTLSDLPPGTYNCTIVVDP